MEQETEARPGEGLPAPLVAAVKVAAAAAALVLLYLLSRSNYLLFHAGVELFAVVVGFAIFVVSWNTRRWVSNDYLLFIGIAYLFVAVVDVFHTLAYAGMGVFPQFTSNEPTQFWVLSRYIEAFTLLIAPLFLMRRLRPVPEFAVYSVVTAFGLLSICRLSLFPDCFVPGEGLTTFKVVSEY
ncbi:MAG: diguanylate cyclase, partial [Dehalococcoidia bacterium]|nr:diguanylate cyclase [Dehalococcoidia bacterium]